MLVKFREGLGRDLGGIKCTGVCLKTQLTQNKSYELVPLFRISLLFY